MDKVELSKHVLINISKLKISMQNFLNFLSARYCVICCQYCSILLSYTIFKYQIITFYLIQYCYLLLWKAEIQLYLKIKNNYSPFESKWKVSGYVSGQICTVQEEINNGMHRAAAAPLAKVSPVPVQGVFNLVEYECNSTEL